MKNIIFLFLTLFVVKFATAQNVLLTNGEKATAPLPVANGGTGANAQNWIDMTTSQTKNVGTTANTTPLLLTGSINDFLQYDIKNTSLGAAAQSGYSASANDGTPTTKFVWLGKNNTGFANPQLYNVGAANDGTLLNDGGNLFIHNTGVTGRIGLSTGLATTPFYTERLSILNTNGNVGIGTIAPTAKLEISAPGAISDVDMLRFMRTSGFGSSTITSYYRPNANGSASADVGLAFKLFTSEVMNLEQDAVSGGINDRVTFRTANVGIGTANPIAKLQVNGAFVTESAAALANQAANFTISAAQVDAFSVIKVGQTTANITLTSIAAPTSTVTGRFLRVHNTGTAVFYYSGHAIRGSTYLDLQWNGTAWAMQTEAKQERTGHILTGDVGSGTAATVLGDFTAVTKASPLLSGRSEYTVTMPALTGAYVVLITPVSRGTLTNDNEIRVPILHGNLSTLTQFTFSVEELSSATQNVDYHILVKQF